MMVKKLLAVLDSADPFLWPRPAANHDDRLNFNPRILTWSIRSSSGGRESKDGQEPEDTGTFVCGLGKGSDRYIASLGTLVCTGGWCMRISGARQQRSGSRTEQRISGSAVRTSKILTTVTKDLHQVILAKAQQKVKAKPLRFKV